MVYGLGFFMFMCIISFNFLWFGFFSLLCKSWYPYILPVDACVNQGKADRSAEIAFKINSSHEERPAVQ